jgi:hypothetical protein
VAELARRRLAGCSGTSFVGDMGRRSQTALMRRLEQCFVLGCSKIDFVGEMEQHWQTTCVGVVGQHC